MTCSADTGRIAVNVAADTLSYALLHRCRRVSCDVIYGCISANGRGQSL